MTANDTNSTSNVNDFWSVPKPDWQKWNHQHRCKLWEAVALACNVDPSMFNPIGLPADIALDSLLTPIPPSMQNLLKLANIAVVGGTLKTAKGPNADLMQRELELSDFTSWLNSVGQTPPSEYPWTARELVAGQLQWPWGIYQTKDLQLLALAADKFWKNYHPSDPTTAPTNETVIAWLKSKGVARRKAEVMASLLRANDLAPGPRRGS